MEEGLRQQACKQTPHVLSLHKQQQAQGSAVALEWQHEHAAATHAQHTAVASVCSCLQLKMDRQQELKEQQQ
jgi:hypothetical protein